jgi:hypothetical protein
LVREGRLVGLLDRLRGLFGGAREAAGAAAADPVEYNGFQITPAPARTTGGWNTAGLITKTVAGEVREQAFVRVDTHSDRDAAIAFSITKARQIIDEQGERLFETERR